MQEQNRSPSSGSVSERPRLDSNPRDTNATDSCSTTPPSTEQRNSRNAADTVTASPSQGGTNSPSGDAAYTVFISHAGEDKATMAIPLRDKLCAKGITAFVDEADMPCGTDAVQAMTLAMETAKIGVIILSPEFIAKKWPMRELMCFLKRHEECSREGHNGREAPTIIPCFYRLSVADLYHEPDLNRKDEDGSLLYVKTRFFERFKRGEPEADLNKIDVALKSLHKIMGVRNDDNANNDSSSVMRERRELLLNELCSTICENVPEGMRTHTATDLGEGRTHVPARMDTFRASFPVKLSGTRAVLDFDGRTLKGHPITPEGQIKHYLMKEERGPASIVSVCGLGGVGKSTIVEVLMSDVDVRERFKDGVHLMRLGSDATDNSLFECICCILEGSGAEKKVQSLREGNNIDEVAGFFMRWFEGKSCVFFIDDVWEHSINVRALSRLCDIVRVDGGNRILITTREHDIAALTPDARIVTLDPRETRGELARKVLLFHAGVAENDVAIADAADAILGILDICAGLPVSLAAAGKSVRKLIRLNKRHAASSAGMSVWKEYLSRLDGRRQALLRENVGSYGNLYATFAASVEFLDEETAEKRTGLKTKFSFAEMHRRLCVLQKQATVPNRMLMHLWGMEREESAEMIAMAFVEVGLGGHEMVQSESGWRSRFSLHDSVHDFAVSEAQRHGEIADAHNLLLEGYGSQHEDVLLESDDKKVRWWSRGIEDDGYIHKQLCRHLVESGRKNELCELLLTPLWAERQVEVNGMMYLEEDFGIGIKEIREGEERREALCLIRDAVILSSGYVIRNMRELWFQLHGRLQGCREGNREIEKYLKWIESDTSKPRVLSVNGGLVGAGGRNTKIISGESGGVCCMSLFPDEERVACGCLDGSVFIVDIRRSEIERKWKAYEGRFTFVRSIAVTQNGTRVVTMPDNALAHPFSHMSGLDVWDVKSGNHVRTIGGPREGVSCFAITHDETRVVSVSGEGSLELWDLKSGEAVVASINVGSMARDITLLKDGRRAIIRYLAGYHRGYLKLWNRDTGANIGEYGDFKILWFTVTPDERHVVCFSADCKVTLLDFESRQQIWSSRVDGFTSELYIVSGAVSKDGSRIASADQNGLIQIWDVESGDQVCEPLKGHTNGVTGVSFVGIKDSIVSCSMDGTVRVWNTFRAKNQKSFATHGRVVKAVSFTPDGKFVVTGSGDGTLRIWDAASQETVGDPLEGHSNDVHDVAVTPDGRFVVSVSHDKTVCMWDLESRKLLRTFEDHTGFVCCVVVTPKGDHVVTGSLDKTVRVWDMRKMDGSHVIFEGHSQGVHRVFVSDDGLRVISVGRENETFVWSLETKEIVKKAVVDAWKMSRREVFSFIGEDTVQDDAGLSIPRWSNQILHGNGSEARVLATLETPVWSGDISPDKKTICIGLEDGQVMFLKVDV